MAYNENFAERIKDILESQPDFEMKRMFGGICYLLRGNMACGVLNDDLIVRVGPDNYEEMLKLPEARKFDITGRPMKGWVMVSGLDQEFIEDLPTWIERGVKFALSLPPK